MHLRSALATRHSPPTNSLTFSRWNRPEKSFLLTNLHFDIYLFVNYTLRNTNPFPCHRSTPIPRFAGFWPKSSASNSFSCHSSKNSRPQLLSLPHILKNRGRVHNSVATPLRALNPSAFSSLPSNFLCVSVPLWQITAISLFYFQGLTHCSFHKTPIFNNFRIALWFSNPVLSVALAAHHPTLQNQHVLTASRRHVTSHASSSSRVTGHEPRVTTGGGSKILPGAGVLAGWDCAE